MKFEAKIKIFIAFLIVLNLIYLKLASEMKSTVKTTPYNINSENNKVLLPIENKNTSDKLSQNNYVNRLISTDSFSINGGAIHSDLKNKSFSDVVAGLGNNIDEALQPVSIPKDTLNEFQNDNNPNTVFEKNNLKEANIIDKNISKIKFEYKESPTKIIRKQSHLFSFFFILTLTTIAALIIINYNIRKDKQIEEKRGKLKVSNNDGYYLIKD